MYNKVFYNWNAIKRDSESYSDVAFILKALASVPIPKKLASKIKPLNYIGTSFLLNPAEFLDVKVNSEFKLIALELASKRNYSDYTLYNDMGVNIEVSPFSKQILLMNPLLELKNDTIYIKTGTLWH